VAAKVESVLGPNFTVIGKQGPVRQRKGRGRAQKTIELVCAMARIAHDCAPITGRGVGYKLFTQKLISSMGRADMQRVYRLLKEEREYGTIAWEAIVDETRGIEIAASWANPEEFAEEMTAGYRRSFWNQQPKRCQVWSEKGSLMRTFFLTGIAALFLASGTALKRSQRERARTGAHHSPVQLFRTIRAPCRSVIRALGQRATAAR
jgi:hypothetical protein